MPTSTHEDDEVEAKYEDIEEEVNARSVDVYSPWWL